MQEVAGSSPAGSIPRVRVRRPRARRRSSASASAPVADSERLPRVVTRAGLVGTRLAAAGAALYFLEWVAIAFLPAVPTARLGDDPAAIVAAYRGHASAVAFAAGWFSFVLLGRVLFATALRHAFRESGRRSALLDFAVAAMAISVVLEVASFVSAAAAGWLADAGADSAVVAGLDAAATVGFMMIFAPLGDLGARLFNCDAVCGVVPALARLGRDRRRNIGHRGRGDRASCDRRRGRIQRLRHDPDGHWRWRLLDLACRDVCRALAGSATASSRTDRLIGHRSLRFEVDPTGSILEGREGQAAVRSASISRFTARRSSAFASI
jgi:hypothetical protein